MRQCCGGSFAGACWRWWSSCAWSGRRAVPGPEQLAAFPQQFRAVPGGPPAEEGQECHLGHEAERAVEDPSHQAPVIFPGRQTNPARSRARDQSDLVRFRFPVPAGTLFMKAAEILEL